MNECSVVKQLTHASFGKNFLQGGDAPVNRTIVPPIATEGWSGGDDGKDEEIIESE